MKSECAIKTFFFVVECFFFHDFYPTIKWYGEKNDGSNFLNGCGEPPGPSIWKKMKTVIFSLFDLVPVTWPYIRYTFSQSLKYKLSNENSWLDHWIQNGHQLPYIETDKRVLFELINPKWLWASWWDLAHHFMFLATKYCQEFAKFWLVMIMQERVIGGGKR